ncbi:fatty acid synthase alpha subunit Lsd1, partial [Coemansia sp. RSA 2611]
IKFPCYQVLSEPNSSSESRPMVSVQGITKPVLERFIARFNIHQSSATEYAYLAVVNTVDQFIAACKTSSSANFVAFLQSQSATPDKDQSRIPYPKRKPVIYVQYTTISAPSNCTLLEAAAEEAYTVAVKKGWVFRSEDMQIAVRASDDGHDIRTESDLTQYLFSAICVLPVDWPQATRHPGVTHIVDFGPGGLSGFGLLAYKNIEGMGVPVICAGALVSRSSKPYLGSKADLFKADLADVTTAPNWLAEFGPKLARTAYDDQLHIDTPMSRVLGAPTVMVAGMTPTTANEEFVAAIKRAGYHVELGGGAIFTESDLERKVDDLVKLAKPGQGITLNCIYMNQRQWSFQYPALLRLRSKGVPIVGLCIGGGVPSPDSATTIIDSLRSVGIRHVSFKPSTAESIRHVINIAKAHAEFPIVLQWTGGRAGGHHSFEDFHQPMLETYAAIRACRNITLVAGSGFGDAEGSLPYITGDWSAEFGRAPMPFDGILLGSRVMVAKEAGTSLAAKELIVAAPGLSNSEWHKTYDGPAGGITTFTSEYGELNHLLATRAAVLVNDLRSTILSQPREKHAALLMARKDEIIARLNRDYLRPWFGRKADGSVADLEGMTYVEVIGRLVELMFVKSQQRWIHESYRTVVLDFVARAERRLGSDLPEMSVLLDLRNVAPTELALSFTARYPAAESQLLHSEEIQFFVSICKRRGQKPVPFIFALDSDFSTAFSKDSIWQSEDLDAIVDQDPQRVVTQQGPVATRYSTVVDEPVKDILDGVYHGHVAALLSRDYGGDASNVPAVEYVGAQPQPVSLPASVKALMADSMRTYQLPDAQDQLPDFNGSSYVDNYVPRALQPRAGQCVTVSMVGDQPQSLEIADSSGATVLKIERNSGCGFELNVHHPVADVSALKSIKALVGGKSTLQNEIVGDLHKEFGSKVPDKAEELSLRDLAAAIGAFGGSLGKHTQAQLARLFGSKMPGGFSLSSARSILQSTYGLGLQRQDALLLVALTMEPPSRLSGNAEAKAWLGTVAEAYAAKEGVSYATASAGGGSSGQAGAPIISSAEMEKMQQKQHEHTCQQIQVLARYGGMDLREGTRLVEREQANSSKLQAKLDRVSAELGDELMDGVQPLFDARKARNFDSSWNWVRQEAYELIQQAIANCTSDSANISAHVDDASLQRLKNRSSPGLLQMLAGSLSILQAANDDSLEPAIRLVSELHSACEQALNQPPAYRELSAPTGPHVDIGRDGTVTYSEIPRPDEPSFVEFVKHMRQQAAQDTPPLIHLKIQPEGSAWLHCAELSATYYEGLSEICGSGLSFAGKTALVTGCGRGSIGADIVCGLLSGGAKVAATTSSFSRKTTLFFEDMYRTHGAQGSELIVVPFNQGSTGDIKQLVDYIYRDSGAAKGLGWDLDYVIPFAAVSDIGSLATNLGSHSEFAQRVLLTNVMRLLGGIKDTKEQLGYETRPSLVVL